MEKEKKGTILALISASAFSTEAILAKLLFSYGVNTITVLTVRFVLAAILMWLYIILFKKIKTLPSKEILKKLILIGFVFLPIQSASLIYSFNFIPAAVGIMCLYTYPILVIIWSALFLGEKITKQKLISLILALSGLPLVIGLQTGNISPIGIFYALFSAFSNSIVVVISGRIVKDTDPLVANSIYITGRAIIYSIVGLIFGNIAINFEPAAITCFILIAVLGTVIPYLSFFASLKYIEASRFGITSMIELVVTAILGVVVLHEMLTGLQIMGGVLMIAGVTLLQIKFPKKSQKDPVTIEN